MSNCPVCNRKMKNPHECTECNFRWISTVGSDREEWEQRDIEEHRMSLMKKIRISVIARKYKDAGNHYEFEQDMPVMLMEGINLKKNETVWSDYKFAQGKRGEDVLRIQVVDGKKKEKAYDCPFTAPDLDDFWYVGFEMTEDMYLHVYVGNKQIHTEIQRTDISLV